MQTSTEDRYLLTAEELQDKIAVMLGGRAAELLTFHKISTGASDDIMRATELARRMVVEFGMSPQLGSVRYAGHQMQYMGQSVEDDGHLSDLPPIFSPRIMRLSPRFLRPAGVA
jgi:cell division protease FtsH